LLQDGQTVDPDTPLSFPQRERITSELKGESLETACNPQRVNNAGYVLPARGELLKQFLTFRYRMFDRRCEYPGA
jgi:hypothetical protein